MQPAEKYAFGVVYAVGLLSPLAAVLRLVYIRSKSQYNPRLVFQQPPDARSNFWAVDDTIEIWITVELAAAFVAYCLASFRTFFNSALEWVHNHKPSSAPPRADSRDNLTLQQIYAAQKEPDKQQHFWEKKDKTQRPVSVVSENRLFD